jgi:uncharacterized protein (DUF3084 family)
MIKNSEKVIDKEKSKIKSDKAAIRIERDKIEQEKQVLRKDRKKLEDGFRKLGANTLPKYKISSKTPYK